MKSKPPQASFSQMTELVLPNDTNTLGNLMGGRLLHYMDIVSAISASRHANRVVVTVSVDAVDFRSPVKLGEILVMEAKVTRAFTTSMEVKIRVYAENMQSGQRRESNTAYYTFVAVDQVGNPIPVYAVAPETEEEKLEYERADARREFRLVQSGRLAPADAKHLHLTVPEKK
jgi:acyl-CoA hydrolase